MSANLAGRKMKKAEKLASLEAMPKTNSAFKNRQITLVKDYYEQNKITSLRTARKLIQLVQENKMSAFGDILDMIEAKASDRAEKRKIGPELLDTKETKRTIIRLKNKTSELPTLEVELKGEHTTFNTAWNVAYKKLIRMAEQSIEIKRPLDKHWYKLSKNDNWFLILPLTVTQLSNYSDIEKKEVNYSEEMLKL
jgi:DNA-binding ferritin-like protein (Dps family)